MLVRMGTPPLSCLLGEEGLLPLLAAKVALAAVVLSAPTPAMAAFAVVLLWVLVSVRFSSRSCCRSPCSRQELARGTQVVLRADQTRVQIRPKIDETGGI